MPGKHSLQFNYIMNLLFQFSTVFCSLLTYPYVSRILTSQGMGRVSFAVSFTEYFGLIAMLGIPTYGIRACARVLEDWKALSKTIQELFFLQFLMTGIALGCFLSAVATVPMLRQEKELYCIQAIVLVLNAFNLDWVYAALEQYDFIAIRTLCIRLIAVVCTFCLIHEKADYIKYALIMMLVNAVTQGVNLFSIRKYISFHFGKTFVPFRHIKPMFFCFGQAAAITVYTNLDIVMLGFFLGEEAVGIYNAAVRVKMILVHFITALGSVIFSRLSYYIKAGKQEQTAKVIRIALKFVLFLAACFFIFFAVEAKDCILLLSSREYLGAVSSMRMLMLTLLFIGCSNITGYGILMPTGREKQMLISVCAGAMADLILNAVLIPKFGILGAAIGTVCAEIAVIGVQMGYIWKEWKLYFSHLRMVKIMIAVVLGFIILLGMQRLAINNTFLRFAVCGISFFSICFAVLLFLQEDMICVILQEIISYLKRKRS